MNDIVIFEESTIIPMDMDWDSLMQRIKNCKKPEIWLTCPDCGKRLCRVETDSKAKKIYVWCKHCKKEVELNI